MGAAVGAPPIAGGATISNGAGGDVRSPFFTVACLVALSLWLHVAVQWELSYSYILTSLVATLLFAYFQARQAPKIIRCPPSPAESRASPEPEDEPPELPEDFVRWSFLPSTGSLRANLPYPMNYENDMAWLKFVVMHRPTHDPARDAAGDYPYSWHMKGRKRIWEVRIQAKFKRIPKGDMFFGLELRPGPTKESYTKRNLKKVLLNMLRKTVGDGIYEYVGDDPDTTPGEAEPPGFVMPLWAVDQYIVTEPGEELPDMLGNIENLGVKRTDGLKAYVAGIKNLFETLSLDRTYTISFWGVSQMVDAINWELKVPPGIRVNCNVLCGKPPIYIVAYVLKSQEDDEEGEGASSSAKRVVPRRHFNSQRDYFFQVALWSEKCPPEPEFLEEMFDAKDAMVARISSERAAERAMSGGKKPSRFRQLFSCGGSSSSSSAARQPPQSGRQERKWVSVGQRLLGSCMGGGQATR